MKELFVHSDMPLAKCTPITAMAQSALLAPFEVDPSFWNAAGQSLPFFFNTTVCLYKLLNFKHLLGGGLSLVKRSLLHLVSKCRARSLSNGKCYYMILQSSFFRHFSTFFFFLLYLIAHTTHRSPFHKMKAWQGAQVDARLPTRQHIRRSLERRPYNMGRKRDRSRGIPLCWRHISSSYSVP